MTLKNKYDVNLLSFDLLNKDDKQIYSLEREKTALKECTCKFIVFLVNTKFEKQKVWFFTTGISIVVASCTIIGFLIKFFK